MKTLDWARTWKIINDLVWLLRCATLNPKSCWFEFVDRTVAFLAHRKLVRRKTKSNENGILDRVPWYCMCDVIRLRVETQRMERLPRKPFAELVSPGK